MAKFEETPLYLALTAETKNADGIKSAIGSAAVDFSCRSAAGHTYVHLAATNLRNTDIADVWAILLTKCDMFTRDANGVSGLDCMIDNLPVGWSNKYLKAFVTQIGEDEAKVDDFVMRSVLSGKTVHLRRLADSVRAKNISAKLSETLKVENEIKQLHKDIKESKSESVQHLRSLSMNFGRRQQVGIADLSGLPALHLATIYARDDMVAGILEKFPEAINTQDNLGRTAMHYAVSLKGAEGEAIVKCLTDCKADEGVKDIYGCDIKATKTTPINMDEFKTNHQTILERQIALDMMYRVHDVVLTGNLRDVKMWLDRREVALKQDASKLTALHKAIILRNTSVATWIAEEFKTAMDVQGTSGLTPMHFAAVVDRNLYESLKKAGGDCHTVDVEGNDPEFYKDHTSDFILDIDVLRDELLVTPPSRPVTAVSERAKSARAASGKPRSAKSVTKPTAPPVMASKKKAPAPETLDAKYIADVLGTPLTAALAEVAEKRPWDPIEYLAQWLYKHKANLRFHQQQIDAVKEAEMEEVRKKEEAESRARRKREAIYFKEQQEEKQRKQEEEARKLKEQEELQKKAKDSIHLAQAPELATVTEDEESAADPAAVISPRNVVDKDEQGRTELHNLVAAGSVDEVKALLATSGAGLLSERDCDGKNARDCAESDEMRECLDGYVVDLLKADDAASINKLLENGYPLESLNIDAEEQELSETATQLLATATNQPKLVEEICNQIKAGDLAALKKCLGNKSQAVCRLSQHGATALHLAVLYEKNEVVQHLVTSFPGIVQCRDNMNRTALHYAYATSEAQRDALVKILVDGKADAEAEDCKNRKPTEYLELAEEVQSMKEATEGEAAEDVAAPAEDEAAPADGEAATAEPAAE